MFIKQINVRVTPNTRGMLKDILKKNKELINNSDAVRVAIIKYHKELYPKNNNLEFKKWKTK